MISRNIGTMVYEDGFMGKCMMLFVEVEYCVYIAVVL